MLEINEKQFTLIINGKPRVILWLDVKSLMPTKQIISRSMKCALTLFANITFLRLLKKCLFGYRLSNMPNANFSQFRRTGICR